MQRIFFARAREGLQALPTVWGWAFSVFTLALIPIYLLHYGPTNFCYFCDLALLLTLATVWSNHPLPASVAAVAILVPQSLWIIDFFARCCGWSMIGMTDYMFNRDAPIGLRALSLFHLWLPLLLWWILKRIGYDRRAFRLWLPCGLVVLVLNRLVLPAPPAPVTNPDLPVNINLVFGLSDSAPQNWMPTWLWFALLTVALVGIAWWPTHLLLSRCMRQPVVP